MIFNKLRTRNSIPTLENLLIDTPEHEWIREDRHLFRFFKEALGLLSKDDFDQINRTKTLCFLFSSGKFASTLSSHEKKQFIILYPEMIYAIKSVDNTSAFAILFHELGHIYHRHHEKSMSTLEKQHEADFFACRYGFDSEILDILYGENKTFEVTKRINKVLEFQKNHHVNQ